MDKLQVTSQHSKTNLHNIKIKNERRNFFFRVIDSHIYIELFKKIKISLKYKTKFPYKKATEYGVTLKKRTPLLIVSLTSFPGRIDSVNKTINTLLNQSVKPDKIILWLADSQFKNRENDLPKELLELQDLGLEIKWCEDLRSYKKLIPSLREFPEDIIVTADDDLYYSKEWLEELYNAYKKNPNYIYTKGAGCLKIKNNDLVTFVPYRANYNYTPLFANVIMSGSGTLFPPHSLHQEVLDTEKFLKFLPTHDDLYFWLMAVKNGTKIFYLKGRDMNMYQREGIVKNGLCKINNENGSGMSPLDAFKEIFNKYPEIFRLIDEEQKNV